MEQDIKFIGENISKVYILLIKNHYVQIKSFLPP